MTTPEKILLYSVVFICWWFIALRCEVAVAQTVAAKRDLVKCIIAESDGRDAAAIAYTLKRRSVLRNQSIHRVTRSYCQFTKAWRHRARVVLVLPQIIDPKYRAWRKLWIRLTHWVEKFFAGEIKDPCRGYTTDWGGRIDPKPQSLKEVDCGETANTFYARIRGNKWARKSK